MKKILFSITTLFAFALNGLAQNGSPFWSLAGNNNASATSKLGTTNDISLRFYTNNVQRMIINSASGFVGIGTPTPVNILTVKSSGGTPADSWLDGLNSPVFVGFAESVSSEFVLAAASSISGRRPVIQGRRSRGTLASPSAVVTNDYLASVLASGYDGSSFQNPATIDFYVDGTPSSGHVPARISFVTGTNIDDRTERLKVGSTGNFNFNNNQLFIRRSDGNVGIGTTSPDAKLHVLGSTSAGTGLLVSGYSYGIQASSTGSGYGVYGTSDYLGVYGAASAGSYGTFGYSGYIGAYGSGTTYGTYGYSYAGTAGAYGSSSSGAGVYGSSYTGTGIYGYSTSSYGGNFESYDSWGLRASTTNGYYAGVFYGHVYLSDGYITSDKNLKKDIREFDDAMSIINKLKPENYEFKDDAKYASLHLPKGRHYGLMAQDLEQVLPNLISEAPHELKAVKQPLTAIKPTEDGKPGPVPAATQQREQTETIKIKAVNYIELIPIMIKAMQEQQSTIEKQEVKIQEQDAKIEALSQLVNSTSKNGHPGGNFTLSSALGNPVPNPASKSTKISYSIPTTFSNAEMVISNQAGQKIKQIRLNNSGLVDIDTSVFSAGTYSYTLIVDGRSVNTKKMVIAK